jgi:peptidoglycan/LPS O-acetylase OafA/YrhL
MIHAIVLSLGHWYEEGPREVLVGFFAGVGVTLALAWLGHHHVVKPLRRLHAHALHQTMLAEETHHFQHTGLPHPRVQARLDRGDSHTPSLA